MSIDEFKRATTRRPKSQGANHAGDFQTLPWAIKPLLPYLMTCCSPNGKTGPAIWEPAAGDGNLATAMERFGLQVLTSDVLTGQDFLTYEPEEHWDALATNPPYELKDAWIARCYVLGKPWALLLPFVALEGIERQDLYREHGIQLLFLPKRPEFVTPVTKQVGGAWFPACWITWKLTLPKDLVFSTYEDCGLVRSRTTRKQRTVPVHGSGGTLNLFAENA